VKGRGLNRCLHVSSGLLFVVLAVNGILDMSAQSKNETESAAAILRQVREATGGDAWNRMAELRAEGMVLVGGKTGTIATVDDLRTGANSDRVVLDGRQVDHHADTPTQDWEQDEHGNILLTPGGKLPEDIDDLYIHRNGWWEPSFGGAAVMALPPVVEDGVTYDRIVFKVPGGKGFTLWIDRNAHHIARIARGESVKTFSDFRQIEGGLTLPFRQQQSGQNMIVLTTTKLVALPQLNEADLKPPFQADYTMPASGQVTVPAEGGLIFKMKINGQGPFRTVFDTGAVNIVSSNFAKKIGLKVKEEAEDFGAIGGAIKVRTALVDTMTIGNLLVRDQKFYVLDLPVGSGEPEVLVGWEMMRRFAVRLDPEHGQITFFDGPAYRYAGHGTAVPLELNKQGNNAWFHAEVDGTPGKFLLDTGNQIGLFLNAGFVDKHGLVKALDARYRGYNGKGFGGDSPEAWFARLHTLHIGDVTITDPVVRLQTKQDGFGNDAGNVGQSVLKRFTLIVDCMRGRMYLEKTAGWNQREVFNRAGLLLDPVDGVDTVKTVLPGSPGEVAGLKSGDRIVRIDGHTPSDDPNDAAFTQSVGTVVHLTVQRNDEKKVYNIALKDVL